MTLAVFSNVRFQVNNNKNKGARASCPHKSDTGNPGNTRESPAIDRQLQTDKLLRNYAPNEKEGRRITQACASYSGIHAWELYDWKNDKLLGRTRDWSKSGEANRDEVQDTGLPSGWMLVLLTSLEEWESRGNVPPIAPSRWYPNKIHTTVGIIEWGVKYFIIFMWRARSKVARDEHEEFIIG